MKYEYSNGIRCPKKITEKAHQTLREKGHYKRDNSYLRDERNPARQPEARKKNSEAKLKYNYMKGKLSPNNVGGKIVARGRLWDKIKKEAIKRDSDKCVQCGMTNEYHFDLYGQPLQVDHIIPYRLTQNNTLQNLQTLCCKCHGAKWKSDLIMIKEYNVTIKD